MRRLGRRRFLSLIAAPAAIALPGAGGARPEAVRWQGTALGARASLVMGGIDAARGRRLIGHVLAEIDRLERIFSLHRADSALSLLNRQGRLTTPPQELVDVLAEAARIHRLSGGAFDVTIQPLWRLHAGHFARPQAPATGPSAAAVAQARERTGFEQVEIGPDEIRFARPGMAITLNGIAQGTVTDRIADLLRGEGLEHVLIDMGEIAATGHHPSGRAWSIGLGAAGRLELRDAAVATTDPRGTTFDAAGRHHHLLDPRTGRSSGHARRVTVVAPRASLADALSTALAVMPPEEAGRVRRRLDGSVRILDAAAHV
ncbi:MAG TPA: FAD:protein FMN transferase [Geminicoccaceae bacterium]